MFGNYTRRRHSSRSWRRRMELEAQEDQARRDQLKKARPAIEEYRRRQKHALYAYNYGAGGLELQFMLYAAQQGNVGAFKRAYEAEFGPAAQAQQLEYDRKMMNRQLYGAPQTTDTEAFEKWAEMKGLKNLVDQAGTLHGINPARRIDSGPEYFIPFNHTHVADHNAHLDAHKEFLKTMNNDPLDQTITLRQIVDAAAVVEKKYQEKRAEIIARRRAMGYDIPDSVRRPSMVNELVGEIQRSLEETDFIKVSFGNYKRYAYRVNHPASRRVKVGDLVTVPPSAASPNPQVVIVTDVNVQATTATKTAVAIDPADRRKLEAAGAVPAASNYNYGVL